jgi:nicotinate-nucleotide pyrophosphorylase (carboxylating)
MRIEDIIDQAVREDQEGGDHTSQATIPSGARGNASIFAKADGILSGTEVARQVFGFIDASLQTKVLKPDGAQVAPGDVLMILEGKSISILKGERIALNFMQRMSGIATKTAQYVKAIEDYPAQILDTRKTTPLMRKLEKKAVVDGGGRNHRMGLDDMIMIKDNHIDFAGGIPQAIDAVEFYIKKKELNLQVEIEVRDFRELEQVLKHGKVNRIMLDNFTPGELTIAVNQIDHRYETEASGGITLETVEKYAASGVDYISIGSLTHHIQSLDISLKADF